MGTAAKCERHSHDSDFRPKNLEHWGTPLGGAALFVKTIAQPLSVGTSSCSSVRGYPVASKKPDEQELVPTGCSSSLSRPDAETINDQGLKNGKDREEDQYRTRSKD